VPWIEVLSGGFGSGTNSTVLTWAVRPNRNTTTRTGTISTSGDTFTVTQAAAPAVRDPFGRIGFAVVDAEYSTALDRLVVVSAEPDELHIVEPVTLAEQTVRLPLPPLSVSVRPDGRKAAVGHDGWVSYIDLQTVTLEKTLEVPTDVYDIVLAGNGYLYLFPQRDWSDIYSLEISSGVWTGTSAIYEGRIARLYATGEYLYVGGNWTSKWDIRQGVAKSASQYSLHDVPTCGDLWLTQDGQRIFTSCAKVYRSSEIASQDFQYNGSLLGTDFVQWASHSAIRQMTAVIPAPGWNDPPAVNSEVRFYGDE
jgi:chitinase